MRRKTLLIGCFGLFIVLGLVLALLMGGDDELLPDDDLRPALRVELPKEQNAYSLLQAIATDLGAGGSLDPAALERAVQAEGYVPPVADFLGDGTGTDVLGMMEVADAASLLVELRLQAGDGVEARRLALLLGAMSDLVASGCGTSLEYLVSLRIRMVALDSLLATVRRLPPSRAENQALQARLEASSPTREQLEEVIRGEYVYARDMLMAVANGEAVGGVAVPPQESSFLFKPNRTCNAVARYHRELIARVALPFEEYQALPAVEEELSGFGALSSFLSGNLVGDTLVRVSMASGGIVIEKRFPMAANFACARAVVALITYEKEHGKLPASLEELVPDYLSKVPTDPYDGQPIRFAPAERLVYSVGSDLKDGGGKETAGPADHEPKVSLDPLDEE